MASVQAGLNALFMDHVNFPVIVYENQLINYMGPVHPVINIITSSNEDH